jgi:hypothetical protein
VYSIFLPGIRAEARRLILEQQVELARD